MTVLPAVTHAAHAGGHRLRLTFDDGLTGVVDCTAWLEGPIFAPLHDEAYFAAFTVDGTTVCWPNGADIAPETLYAALKGTAAA